MIMDEKMESDAFREAFGERLRAERRRLGLSQTEMAEAGDVKKQAQMRYEGGLNSPQAEYLNRVAALGVNVGYVLTGKLVSDEIPQEEVELVERFRASTPDTRRAVLNVLGMSAKAAVPGAVHASTERRIHVGENSGGHVVIGSNVRTGDAINVGSRGKRTKAPK